MSQDIANQLFLVYLGRPADVAWRKSTADLLNSAAPPVALQNAFYSAAVLEGVYSLNDSPSTLVNKIFLNIFGFAANGFEQQQWGDLITKGVITAQTAAWTIFNSYLGATNLGALSDTYQVPARSKLIVVDAYTTELGNNGAANVAVSQIGGAAAAAARTVISGVATAAGAANLQTSIASTVSAVSTASNGTSFTLTTGSDSLTGTANNDVFGGIVYTDSVATSTFQSSDVLVGGVGTDTLNVQVQKSDGGATGAGVVFPNTSVSGVEIFNVRFLSPTAGNDLTIAASNFSGLTTVNADRSTAKLVVTGLATGGIIGEIGNGSVVNGAIDFAYATPTDAVTLALSGGTKASAITNTGTGATAYTINSTGAANTTGAISLAATATVATLTVNASSNLTTGAITNLTTSATVNVLGTAGKVSLGTLTGAKTIDASGLTAGGLTATVDTVTTSLKGGAGSDVITTAATTAASASIDGGAGTDTLELAATNDVSTTAKGALYTAFETLRLNNTQDVSIFASGITALELNAMTAKTISGLSAAQAAAVTVRGDQTTSLALTLKDATGSSDVVSLNLSNSAATAAAPAAVKLNALTIAGVETLNVASNGGVVDAATLANNNLLDIASASSLTAITVTGASTLNMTGLGNLTKAVTIDASAVTGTAWIVAGGNLVKGSTVTGTANGDTLTTNAAAITGAAGDFITYNGGAGADTIITTVAALNNTNAGNASVKIDGGAGTDTVSAASATFADANFQFVTNVEKLTYTGTSVLNVTTGGFFDNNFKTSGVTITAATLDGGSTVFDATSFSGKLTTALTQTAAGAVGDVFTVKSGSGDDSLVLTTNKALTSTTSVINSGAGNDAVTINAAALAVTGKITVNLGAGSDSLTATYAGAGLLDAAGGAGADTIALASTHTNIANIQQTTVGDSGAFTKPSTNTISTVSFDVVTGAKTTLDTITLSNNASSAVVQVTDLSTGAYANDTISQAKGTYDAVAKTFVAGAGSDSLVIYDSTNGATVTNEAIVIVGIAGTYTAAAGVVTIV